MHRIALILALTALLTACNSNPKQLQVDSSINAYGVPEPQINGHVVPFTLEENREIIQDIIDLYYPDGSLEKIEAIKKLHCPAA